MKPKYEKAAKGLKDLAQVAAIDCDDEGNKPLCGSMGVQGFPTLKIVKPSKKPGKPIVEDYQGQRETKAIIEAVKSAIPNNVKKITDKGLAAYLDTDNSTAKAILFSDKAVTSALTKVLANELLDKINFAQIRNKEAAANEMFGVTEYPTLLVLPGGTDDAVIYDGAYTKIAMQDFLRQYASGQDSTLKEKVKEKVQKVMGEDQDSEPTKAAEADESSFSSASSSHQASEASSAAASATEETLVDDSNPTESPEPAVTPEAKPIPVPSQPEPIPTLEEQSELQIKCLGEKTSTCVLALLPIVGETLDETIDETVTTALASLAELSEKHKERKGNLFPFYSVPASNTGSQILREALKLGAGKDVELIAVNGRRGWFRRFETGRFDSLSVETWIDNIRFGEGAKGELPDELLATREKASATPAAEATPEEGATPEEAAIPEAEASAAPTHEEL